MLQHFEHLACENLNEFIYGVSKKPVTLKNGMVIGGGMIYPELNFTMPTMLITKETMPEVLRQYKEIIEGACKRAKELYLQGFVAEVELLPPTTYNPQWGIDIVKTVKEVVNDYEQKYGLKTGIRITPVDIREDLKSPICGTAAIGTPSWRHSRAARKPVRICWPLSPSAARMCMMRRICTVK
jgi:methanol--5-hydroxybenzimidazolylcobamide Co-methyltransferase